MRRHDETLCESIPEASRRDPMHKHVIFSTNRIERSVIPHAEKAVAELTYLPGP